VPDDHPDSVPATIALAVRGAATMHPAVTDALSLCSVLARRPVLLSMLTAAAPHLPEPLGPALAEPVERNDLVVTMRRFSVVERLEEEHLVLHRLTQDTTEVGHDDFRVPKPCRARGWRRTA
jgi:hypothetical protein